MSRTDYTEIGRVECYKQRYQDEQKQTMLLIGLLAGFVAGLIWGAIRR